MGAPDPRAGAERQGGQSWDEIVRAAQMVELAAGQKPEVPRRRTGLVEEPLDRFLLAAMGRKG